MLHRQPVASTCQPNKKQMHHAFATKFFAIKGDSVGSTIAIPYAADIKQTSEHEQQLQQRKTQDLVAIALHNRSRFHQGRRREITVQQAGSHRDGIGRSAGVHAAGAIEEDGNFTIAAVAAEGGSIGAVPGRAWPIKTGPLPC
jgi:hypothetical protein